MSVEAGRPGRRLFAFVLMAGGIALWAYTAAWLTPAVEQISSGRDDSGELYIWVHEQRELAILIVVTAMIVAFGRSRVPWHAGPLRRLRQVRT